MEIKLYLVVNRHKEEFLYTSKPYRDRDSDWEFDGPSCVWVQLPKGTIKRLTNIDATYETEPIVYKENFIGILKPEPLIINEVPSNYFEEDRYAITCIPEDKDYKSFTVTIK